jgi:2,3-bisphosphoglycerate-dependent phosphoglycerate mutase
LSRTGTLILVRHGESTANAAGAFTGLRDVDLSPHGVHQSHQAAALIASAGLRPDVVFTSRMLRARRTAALILADLDDVAAPVVATWRLNERDYGLLMGMSKADVRERFGAERFYSWRRTLHGTPPPMPPERRDELGLVPVDEDPDDPQPPASLGEGESLHDVVERIRALWEGRILPRARSGECVLIVAHGNSLRALSALVDRLGEHELEELNLPTAQPIAYDIAPDGTASPRGGRYLDPDTAVVAAIRIMFEGGT